MSLALRVLATLAALLWAAVVRSEVITVASPFPKELLMVYKRAIEEQYPGLRVQYVHFPATNAVSFLQDRAPGTRPDVFWGSAPDTFLSLRRNGLLEQLGEELAAGGGEDGVEVGTSATREFPSASAAFRSTTARAISKGRRCPATASCGTRATSRRAASLRRATGATSPAPNTSAMW